MSEIQVVNVTTERLRDIVSAAVKAAVTPLEQEISLLKGGKKGHSDKYLTYDDISEMFNISKRTIDRMCEKRVLTKLKLKGTKSIFFRPSDVEAAIEEETNI